MKEESSSCRDRDGAGDGVGEDEGGSGGVEGGGEGGVGHHLGYIDSRCSGKSSVNELEISFMSQYLFFTHKYLKITYTSKIF